MAKLWVSVGFQTSQSRLEPLSSIAQKISFRTKSQQIKNGNTNTTFPTKFAFVLTEFNYFCCLALFSSSDLLSPFNLVMKLCVTNILFLLAQ